MKVKLVKASTFAYGGKIYKKGDVFEIPKKAYEKLKYIVQVIEKQKVQVTEPQKKEKKDEEEG